MQAIFLVILLLVVSHPAGASVAPLRAAPLQTPDYERWETDKLYQYGNDLLRRGRTFERAIDALSIAARREPKNLEYQLALGCACASRFASVTLALRQMPEFTYAQKTYSKRLADWEKAQSDPTHREAGVSPPLLPVLPVTPDDGRRFDMSKEEAQQHLLRLGQKSVAAFNAAQRLAEDASPERQAEAFYRRGWGLLLLWRFSDDVISNRRPPATTTPQSASADEKPGEVYVTAEDISASFRRCVEADPSNSSYWHSLGLSLVPEYLRMGQIGEKKGHFSYLDGTPLHTPEQVSEAVSALQRALSRKRQDFDLLYHLALITAPTLPAESTQYMEQAARRAGGNAVLWYLLAEQQFREAKAQKSKGGDAAAAPLREKAVAAVRAGNLAPQFQAVAFNVPVPVQLRKAWAYGWGPGLGNDTRIIVALFSWLGEFIEEKTAQGDDDGILSAAQDMMSMGLRAVRSGIDALNATSGNKNDPKDPHARAILRTRALMGLTNSSHAYNLVKKAQEIRPDARKQRYIDENADLIKYLQSIDKELLRFR